MNSSRTWLIGILVIAFLLFVGGGVLLYLGLQREETAVTESETVGEGTGTAVAAAPTQSIETAVAQTVAAITTASAVPPTLPVPATATNAIPPTATLIPTVLATATPPPTDTPVPTPTAVPPTNTPVPVILPTATATPVPPTNTPTPVPGPQPGNHQGLTATHFALQDWRTNPVVGGEIWYEWTVANSSGAGVPYSTIGILPRKDGVDRVQWYQNNWGGNNDVMPPEGLSWPSWMSLPEPGNYTLRVVVCFDGFQTCKNGQGTFHTLSEEIPITIR